MNYTIPTRVNVRGINTYGGDVTTRGTVYPGNNLTLFSAIELSITQNFVFACDLVASFTDKSRFKGTTIAQNHLPSSAQISLAPAFEYNFSAGLGLIFGSWFTLTGRNANQFFSGVIALNYFGPL